MQHVYMLDRYVVFKYIVLSRFIYFNNLCNIYFARKYTCLKYHIAYMKKSFHSMSNANLAILILMSLQSVDILVLKC